MTELKNLNFFKAPSIDDPVAYVDRSLGNACVGWIQSVLPPDGTQLYLRPVNKEKPTAYLFTIRRGTPRQWEEFAALEFTPGPGDIILNKIPLYESTSELQQKYNMLKEALGLIAYSKVPTRDSEDSHRAQVDKIENYALEIYRSLK